jgi:glycosyltransferase involved in cell wall biosynthesis
MLAARAGGMVDVLDDGRTAFLFDPGDEARCAWALQAAARLDEERRLEMSAACRKLAENELDAGLEIDRYVEALTQTSRARLAA